MGTKSPSGDQKLFLLDRSAAAVVRCSCFVKNFRTEVFLYFLYPRQLQSSFRALPSAHCLVLGKQSGAVIGGVTGKLLKLY